MAPKQIPDASLRNPPLPTKFDLLTKAQQEQYMLQYLTTNARDEGIPVEDWYVANLGGRPSNREFDPVNAPNNNNAYAASVQLQKNADLQREMGQQGQQGMFSSQGRPAVRAYPAPSTSTYPAQNKSSAVPGQSSGQSGPSSSGPATGATGGSAAAATRGNSGPPISGTPAMLPTQTQSYSDWVKSQVDAKLTGENPEQGKKHYDENKMKFWSSFADWAIDNVEDMGETLYLFMMDMNSWINVMFPLRLSKATRFVQKILNINQELPDIQTRKVPARNIGATVITREAHAIYTIQGFQMDYHFMKTPDGMKAFDMMVEVLTANLWAFVMYQSLNAMLYTPSYYRQSNQLYPFSDVPRSVDELINLHERRQMFILNKKPMAFYDIVAGADRIMNQKQKSVSGLIMARDDMWYLQARDQTQNYRDKSGPVALRNRLNAGSEKSLDGVQLYPVPLVLGRLHDAHFSPLLQSVIQLGGFVRFPELSLHVAPADYSSEMRSVRMAAVSKNCMVKYTIIDVIAHSLEFYPSSMVSSASGTTFDDDVANAHADSRQIADNPSDKSGQINRPLLHKLIADSDGLFRTRLRTRFETNEAQLSPLIAYDESDFLYGNTVRTEPRRFHVIDMIGEIAECQLSVKNLTHVSNTMMVHMTKGMTKEDIVDFERGLAVAKELSVLPDTYTANIDDILSRAGANPIESATHAKIMYARPNRFGGTNVDIAGARDLIPYGLGNISGFLTIDALHKEHPGAISSKYADIISRFVKLYRTMIDALLVACPQNPCLSPSLVPFFHETPEMSDFTRIMIVAWYTLFAPFIPPHAVNGRKGSDKVVTQFTFQQCEVGAYLSLAGTDSAALFGVDLDISYLGYDAGVPISDLANGTLFASLSYVHPDFPMMTEADDAIKDDIAKRLANSKVARINVEGTVANLYENSHKADMYTYNWHAELESSAFMKKYPAALVQMLACPLWHTRQKATEFQVKFAASTLLPRLAGVAMRAVMFSRANIATLTAFHENNIRIPFGAMILRPFETQIAHSAIAVSAGVIGDTNFSGYDNSLIFNPLNQHFSVQAFTQVAAVVSDNEKYLVIPAVRGGAFIGGKGHMFVNQDLSQHVWESEEIRMSVVECNGEKIGDRSCIGVLTSYNYATDKQESHHFDIRGHYSRGDFAGRLQNSARDFVDMRNTLAYPGAPILNLVFPWQHDVAHHKMIDNMNFSQQMQDRARNHVVSETLSEVWCERHGWKKTPSYHVWGETEQDGCRDIQQSHSSVVKAYF